METLMNYIPELIGLILTGVILPLIPKLGKIIGRFLDRKIKDIDNTLLQEAAYVAVRWASQTITGGGHGLDKFNQVLARLEAKFPYLPSTEIEEAIEAAVKNLKIELGNVESSQVSQ